MKINWTNALKSIPAEWALTPVKDKRPLRPDWQSETAIARDELINLMSNGQQLISSKGKPWHCYWNGVGLRTGIVSGGLVAIDMDGRTSQPYMLSHLSNYEELPRTVAWTSGRPGRSQHIYRVPQQYWSAIANTEFKTGAKGEDGEVEQVELRWDGCQSVLPPSVHPITGQYCWLVGCAPWECEVAEAPQWVVEKMLKPAADTNSKKSTASNKTNRSEHYEQWSDTDWALSYLNALSSSRAEDYEDWVAVGMALHSVDDSLLREWDAWSAQSSKYKSGDCDRKWKSFKRSGVAIGTLAHMAKSDGWKSPFGREIGGGIIPPTLSEEPHYQAQGSNKKQTRREEEDKKIEEKTLIVQIEELLKQNLKRSEWKAALIAVAKNNNRSTKEVSDLADIIESEFELVDARAETSQAVDNLLAASESSLDIQYILPTAVAAPLSKLASWLNLKPEVYLTTLLTVVSTLQKVGTKLIISEALDFEVTPNLFTALIAESSQKKSPVLKTIAYKPLRSLQAEARKEYKYALNQYTVDIDRWNSLKGEERASQFPDGKPLEPRQKVYYMSGVSGEGLYYQMQSHPTQGLLYTQDELAGIFKSANMYRQGRGSDEEDLLSLYDGSGITIVRASGIKADLDATNLGILGSIQPAVLQSFMKDCSDSNGKWARFMFVHQPNAASSVPESGGYDLNDMLVDLYKKIDTLKPTTYRLSKEAFDYYRPLYAQMEVRRVNDSSQGMRSIWGKSEGRIGKLALNLHVIHEIINHRVPSEFIPKERVVEAFELTKFYIQQVKALHVQFSDDDAIAPHLAKIISISKSKGWIKVRDVQRSFNSKSCPRPDVVKTWFAELEAMGKGNCRLSGRSIEFSSADLFVDSSVGSSADKKSSPLQALQANVDLSNLSTQLGEKNNLGDSVQKNTEISRQIRQTDKQVETIDFISGSDVDISADSPSTQPVGIGDEVRLEDGSIGIVSTIFSNGDLCVDLPDGSFMSQNIHKVRKTG